MHSYIFCANMVSMADTPVLKTVAIDPELHQRVDIYAAQNKLTIREVIDTAVKLFLPPIKGGKK